MEEKNRKTIKTIGIILIVLSALIAFGNGMGAIVFLIIGKFEPSSSGKNDFNALIWNNYLILCLTTLFLAILNIIGGIGLTKYRNWGRVLVIIDSTLFIILMIIVSVVLMFLFKESLGPIGLLMPILSGLTFMIPFILLIRYLTRNKIRINFA
jgi:ABC-type spermidine/putrescine transport system permease subunit II